MNEETFSDIIGLLERIRDIAENDFDISFTDHSQHYTRIRISFDVKRK